MRPPHPTNNVHPPEPVLSAHWQKVCACSWESGDGRVLDYPRTSVPTEGAGGWEHRGGTQREAEVRGTARKPRGASSRLKLEEAGGSLPGLQRPRSAYPWAVGSASRRGRRSSCCSRQHKCGHCPWATEHSIISSGSFQGPQQETFSKRHKHHSNGLT